MKNRVQETARIRKSSHFSPTRKNMKRFNASTINTQYTHNRDVIGLTEAGKSKGICSGAENK